MYEDGILEERWCDIELSRSCEGVYSFEREVNNVNCDKYFKSFYGCYDYINKYCTKMDIWKVEWHWCDSEVSRFFQGVYSYEMRRVLWALLWMLLLNE